MDFKKVELEEICNGMRCEFYAKNLGKSHLIDILIIQFSGEYRPGSEGKTELGFMIGKTELGKAVWRPFNIVIDISNVKYEWGDDMELLINLLEPKSSVMIVGDKNRRALSTLLFGLETDKDIVDNKLFFENLEKGIEKLQRK